MHDGLYQTLFECEICGTNVPVPDPDGPSNFVLVACEKCGTEYRTEFNRLARPDGWLLDCTVCEEDRYVAWEAIHSKDKPWRPTCDSCGSRMDIESAE